MMCDNCGAADAVFHLTEIETTRCSVAHLCEKCAAAKGLDTEGEESPDFPLTDFLAQIGGSDEEDDPAPAGDRDACSFCGLTFSAFRETGRLGCPHCYVTFEGHLKSLLRRIHGATQHAGKVYLPPDPTASEKQKRLEGLKRRLQRAVSAENFERAAELRDEIRAMEPIG